MEEKDVVVDKKNVQAELLFVGSFYKSPELYLTYGGTTKSKYDLSDNAMRFFYDLFEDYYLTFSQDFSENKMNNFATQNMERLKSYREYGGWKTIKSIMDMADPNDFKNIYNTVKKYSLIREYDRNGFPADKILTHKKFQYLTPNDIYRLMRSKADKINTEINVIDEPIIMTKDIKKTIDNYLVSPQFGTEIHWRGYNDFFRGLLPGHVLFQGFLANEGKSRNIVNLIAYVVLVKKQRFMLLSNEMTYAAILNCFITTVICGEEYKALHGIDIKKPEKEITMGLYRDDKTGEFITRKCNAHGEFIESEEDYKARIRATKEYQNVAKIAEWVENQLDGKFYYTDITSDYSEEAIELEMRRAKILYKCNHVALDTLKAYGEERWEQVKKLATKVTEITKELGLFTVASFQLTDDSLFCDIFDLSSNNISAAKGIKHPADLLVLGKKIAPDEYHKYQYEPYDDDLSESWGEPTLKDLHPEKFYFGIKIDKNRLGERNKVLLFEYNLNFNEWKNIGLLHKRR
jgi:hypothetical protein